MRFLLTRGRASFLAVLALLLGVAAVGALHVRVDASNRSMHAERPADVAVDRELREAFGARDEILLVVAEAEPIGAESLERLARIERALEALPGVHRTTSLASAKEIRTGAAGVELAPLFPGPAGVEDIAAALARSAHLEGLLVSRDRRAAAIVAEIEDLEGEAFDELVAAIRALRSSETRGGVEIHATGLALQKHDVARLVERDQRLLVPLCLAVLAVLLGLVFRRASGVVLPLAVTGASLVLTIGAYGWSGLALNPITSLLPPVVLVLSVVTSVHLYRAWLVEEDTGIPLERAISAVRRVARPCLFATVTTAFGLGSLAFAETPAIRHFGAFAALAAILSFGLAITLVPLGLASCAPPRPGRSGGGRVLGVAAALAVRRPAAIVAGFAALTATAALGVPRIVTDTDLISFLPAREPLVRDTRAVDRVLGASHVIEIVVAPRDGGALGDVAHLRRLAGFVEAVLAEPAVSGVVSLVPIAERIHAAATGREGLPDTADAFALVLDLLAAGGEADLLRQVVDPAFTKLRVRVAVRSIGSAEAARLIGRIEAVGRERLGAELRLGVGGEFVRFALDSNRIVATQIETFALAFVLVFGAIAALLRSPARVALAVVSNLVPIVWTAGLMGFAGIELSTGTAMIACVVLGLVVDDTIHYLVRFGAERTRGSAAAAVRRTTPVLGATLAITTIVLAAGFSVGVLGSFRPAIQFSLLTAFTMTTALLADLLLLPALLVLAGTGREPA